MKPAVISVVVAVIALVLLLSLFVFDKGPYTAEELGIESVTCERDDDGDGTDNYSDILLSARAYVNSSPIYRSAYYDGGYPNDGCGVSIDVVCNALFSAGIDVRTLVDADIRLCREAYPHVKSPDPNIDFRRIMNLETYFKRNCISLTTDVHDVDEWQAGDIVILSGHIAICSDMRNRKGVPYIIHHTSEGATEADDIYKYTVTGHYRMP